jgi:4-amino-4-deoxy-L-arabinose transferase-like glycosyltransferase/Flp pilus assembly protein TadD
MPLTSKPKFPWWACLLLVFTLALALRLIAFAELHHTPFFDLLIGDAQGYDLWAQSIAAGDWQGGDQVFYQAPAYPYFLAVIYKFFGHSPNTVRILQCILGALSALMLAQAGRKFFDKPAGLFAGLLYAFYPIAIFYDLTLQKSSLDGFFMSSLLLALACLYSTSDSSASNPQPRTISPLFPALAGLATGLLILTRENALALVPILLIITLLFTSRLPKPKRILTLILFLFAMALTLAPVALRNHAVSGQWVLTTSQAGSNFYIGNHPGADGSYQPLLPGRGSYLYERTDATNLAQEALGRPLTPKEVSSYWMDQALDYIKSNPADYFALLVRKTALTFNALEAGDTEDPYTYADDSWVLYLTLASLNMGTLSGLALIGMVLSCVPAGGQSRKPAWAIAAIVLTFAASVIAFYVFGRYRFPMAPGLALLSGLGISRFLDHLAFWLLPPLPQGEGRGEGVLNSDSASPPSSTPNPEPRTLNPSLRPLLISIIAFITIYLLTSLPLLDKNSIKSVTYNNIGKEVLEQQHKPEQAIELFEKSLKLNDKYAQAYNNLAAAMEPVHGPGPASLAYAKAVQLQPTLSSARYNLVRTLIATDQLERAMLVIQESLQNPARTNEDAASLLAMSAKIYTKVNQPDEAVAKLQQAAALAPADADIQNSLGIAQAQNKRMDLAETAFAKAITLNPKHPSARFNRARALIALKRPNDAFLELSEHLANYPADQSAKDLLATLK